jgi:glycosyltransferase involved in cell wall biosynthesis
MKLAYISTNTVNGGSEVLMLQSAAHLADFYETYLFTKYDIEVEFQNKKLKHINYYQKLTLFSKFRNRIKRETVDLRCTLDKIKPSLVIISQGSPLASLKEMEMCISLKLNFVVINQLVCEYHWLDFRDTVLERFINCYQKASKIFFVSQQNESLFKQFFGSDVNTFQINNPVSTKNTDYVPYPEIKDNYQIAYVGRYEFFHKGLDLLIESLRDPKWKERNVNFNFFGNGPHKLILQNQIKRYNLYFCSVNDYTTDIRKVWEKNHLAILTSRFEGKSISITESMSFGRACILTDVGGASEQIEDGISGCLIKHFNIESISETLEIAWQRRNDWEVMGQNARQKYLQDNKVDVIDIFNDQLIKLV